VLGISRWAGSFPHLNRCGLRHSSDGQLGRTLVCAMFGVGTALDCAGFVPRARPNGGGASGG
jgi:hypothetical protein